MFSGLKLLGMADDGMIGIARLVSVYVVAGGGYTVAGGGGTPSVATTIAKCLPILSLALCTARKARSGCEYARFITIGLVLSACGDALLAWEQLALGMLLFAGALLVYTAAMPITPLMPERGLLITVVAAVVVCQLRVPAGVAALVPLYAACLCGAAWRAGAARGAGAERGAAALGLELFAFSDACLACHMFYKPLPFHQLIVMGTYYTAQLLIALSSLAEDPAPEIEVDGHELFRKRD